MTSILAISNGCGLNLRLTRPVDGRKRPGPPERHAAGVTEAINNVHWVSVPSRSAGPARNVYALGRRPRHVQNGAT